MVAWGAVVTGFINTPEAVARARDRRILKRLRGTPLETGLYFGGRLVSALEIVLATAALILLVGLLWFDLDIAWSGLPLAAVVLVLGTTALVACGLLLVSVLPSSKAAAAVGLGIAIPLGFFSDIFAIGATPAWMGTVGSFLPLKHLANSVSLALDPGGPRVSWLAIAVMSAWLLGASLAATRAFRWTGRS